MQEGLKHTIHPRSGKDRRKVHTFLMDDRRLGPFCRRHANRKSEEGQRRSQYWDWRSGNWKSLR